LWIVNASPVISLAKIGQIPLLDKLADLVVMPDAVAAEILAGPPADPARALITSGWGQRASPALIPDALMEWGLGAGETSVLAMTLERTPATAILDDSSAWTAARAFNIPVIGTLGIVIRAKLHGLVPSAGA
jgi:predicted nucleic acid-binding protein